VNGGRSSSSSESSSIKTSRSAHDPNSLPPAVAALLAMTTIPPRRPQRRRKLAEQDQPVSIEDLVSSWKSDDSLRTSSYGSPKLSMLLEDADDDDESVGQSRRPSGVDEEGYFNVRSSSSESMPSLEADDRSVLSFNSLATPDSLRSRRSISTLRRDRLRSVPAVEECLLDHPLAPQSDEDEEEDVLQFSLRSKPSKTRKAKSTSSFKSNLTLSLQSLKNAALNSISSLRSSSSSNSNNSSSPLPPSRNPSSSAHLDDMLWSHPFLFPRFSSEVRPASPEHSQKSTSSPKSSKSSSQYLNPMPLTFEEQDAPFQKALHEPYLLEASEDSDDAAPTIQMRTYNSRQQSRRGKGRRPVATVSPDPNSEAGRALLGAPAADAPRTREVRENSDFLRIVVMEMNMRRLGKLESAGRARIWLPPREASPGAGCSSSPSSKLVPNRWVGVSAY
jgi:hypothetical protein